MELAAQEVRSLAQRILPDRPHYLCVSPDVRNNLEYSTFISADRGILLTRPYYEIREAEPYAPSPAKKPTTKMSLQDYRNRGQKISPSPPEPFKSELRQHNSDNSKASKAPPKHPDHRRRPSDVAPTSDRAHGDTTRSKPRIPSRNGRSPSPNPVMGSPELPDSARSHKKGRIETTMRPEPSRAPKPDPVANKHAPAPGDKTARKDRKAESRLLPNGRGASNSQRPTSPPRRTSVNGIKPSSGGSGVTVPGKSESSKSHVPPLLSPLRLGLDDDHDATIKAAPRRPDTGTNLKSATTPTKLRKVALPPLLSPTLPEVVEKELARLKKTPLDSEDEEMEPEETTARKPVKSDANNDAQKSLLVVLKYKKRNSVRISRLLALEPASKREALKKERSISADIRSPSAKKRPRQTEPLPESVASKRPRASLDTITVSKAQLPSTPLKTATAMSRAASSNSTAQTPGGGTNGLTPGLGDRPSTSHEAEPARNGSTSLLRHKHKEWTSLGTQLKHKRDGIVRSHGNGPVVDVLSSITGNTRKQVAVLSVEMVLSFMVGFDALNQLKNLERKTGDHMTWESLLPHLAELKNYTSQYRVLDGLRMQLHAIVLEELHLIYIEHDLANPARLQSLKRCSNDRKLYWTKAHDCLGELSDPSVRANLGPWNRPPGAASAALRLLRRWTERENVEWCPELNVSMSNGA